MSFAKPVRQPLLGSCHCGAVRYVLWLTLPSSHDEAHPSPTDQQRFYRCNCTTCHKMGLFHVRPADVARDFLLLSPLNPSADLGDYLTGDKEIHFFFCKTCAVRCLTFAGGSEIVEVDLAELKVPGHGRPGNKTKVWRPTADSGDPSYETLISVNAHTLNTDQEVFDMRDLTEKKQVKYLDTLSDLDKTLPVQWDRPHYGGCY